MAVAAGLAVGLLISGFTVWNASSAAFSGTTDNTANQWVSGAVNLADNDGGATAMFASAAKQGTAALSKCIEVTYVGDIATPAANVRLYGDSTKVAAADFSTYIGLTVEIGSFSVAPGVDPTASCANFVADAVAPLVSSTLYTFENTKTSYASGVDTGWLPAIGAKKAFRFTTQIQNTAAAENNSITGIPFTWELRG
ncbi:hypothetical protein [Actinoplanes sp. L3-i22]|uniref:hypothetical protein n=1 Tax=Actinoplanes sp. L3-i22 TaxID=2836373 RepID=UPI001C76E211|nr:hypothetical protein [Actinoplanes sp. L3-i22]BCY06804.1 hypothetical protein L3i22_018920 [Actinoplanes sp. L3-i22]